eukprot:1160765-Pelagomonas_calceolata.AAC.5
MEQSTIIKKGAISTLKVTQGDATLAGFSLDCQQRIQELSPAMMFTARTVESSMLEMPQKSSNS